MKGLENRAWDELMGALVGLARGVDSHGYELTENTQVILWSGVSMAAEERDEAALGAMTDMVHEEKGRITPDCATCQYPCGRTDDYDMAELYASNEEIKNAKLRLLEAIFDMQRRTETPGERENELLYKGIFYLGEYLTPDMIEPLTLEIQAI